MIFLMDQFSYFLSRLSFTLNFFVSHPWQPKVHVILRSYVVLTWTYDDRELAQHVTLWNNTECNIVIVEIGAHSRSSEVLIGLNLKI